MNKIPGFGFESTRHPVEGHNLSINDVYEKNKQTPYGLIPDKETAP